MRSPVARGVAWGLAVLVCVVGMWVSLHLALQHYKTSASSDDGVLSRVCTAFATASCEKVAKSRWAWFPPLPPEGSEQAEKAKERQSTVEDVGQSDNGDKQDNKEAAAKAVDKDAHPGVPTAQLGLLYFSFVLVWLVFTGTAVQTRVWPHVIFMIGAVLGAAGSAFYDYVMWTQLDAWCPLCFVTHVGSWLLPILGLVMWPRQSANADPEDMPEAAAASSKGGLFGPAPVAAGQRWSSTRALWPSNRVIVTTIAFALLLGLLEHTYILKYSFKRKTEQATLGQEYFKKKWMQYERYWIHNYYAWGFMPVAQIPVQGRPVRGPANALHTVVLFSDFECPACAKFESYFTKQVLPLKTKAGQQAFKVIFKHWPICKDCNDLMTGDTLHPAACQAAVAAEAARMVGGDEAFWKMHDLLFANQAAWKKGRNFLPYARQIGLDEGAFNKALNSSEALSRVREDIADGVKAGSELGNPARQSEIKVDSTPTIFVDGRRLNSPQFAKTWQSIMTSPVMNASGAASRPAGNTPTGNQTTAAPAPGQ